MKHKIGETHSCSKCGTVLESYTYWGNALLLRLPIGEEVIECPRCHQKYRGNKIEFFHIDKKLFYEELILYSIAWIIPFLLISGLICDWIGLDDNISFCIVLFFVFVIFMIVFKIKWENAIAQSKLRINNKEYLADLLNLNLITEEQITEYYKQDIITKEVYDEVITKKHQKVKELLEELEKMNKKKSEEINKTKKKVDENLMKQIKIKNSKKKHCTECGAEIESSWKFCKECGNKLN